MAKGLKIVCLGGGPASLYFSILMKRRNPAHDITVIERGERNSTWGFGVVFSAETLKGLMEADAESYGRIVEHFAYWDAIDTTIHGERIISRGHGFCGMSRLRLLNIFHDRCSELGIKIRFNTDISHPDQLEMEKHDLVVAGDGITSIVREAYRKEFGTTMDWRANMFCWLATTKPLDDFTFIFRENEHGWWWVHAYRYEEGMTTWIVETSEATWKSAGMDTASEEETKAYCEDLFKDDLGGHPLITNRSVWRTFPVVRNERLYYKNIVLMGDAVRSAHFSIGSGTKLAMEDAIALAGYFEETGEDVAEALDMYQRIRKDEADRLQRTAVVSLRWFEHIDRYAAVQDAEQFTFNMMCRAKRVTYENLRLRDSDYIARIDKWFARYAKEKTGFEDIDTDNPTVPAFQPFRIGKMRVENRFQLSAMCQYCAEDGDPTDWHLMHYGQRAVGGVGLINTETLSVSPHGRITHGCAGIWSEEQVRKWGRIVDFVHRHSKAKICAQIGHSGRKGATCIPWDGGIDQPLPAGAWETIAPSAIPYLPHSVAPREMTAADMDAVTDQFVAATSHVQRAGFDMLELHLAHGYLLSSFISPYTNHREDEYGGDVEGRMRFPMRVLTAVRRVWPAEKPLSARISATDWVERGLSESDMLAVARALKDAGIDIINVSTGQVTKDEDPVYGRMFQAPFADQIRNEIGIPTIVAGNTTTADQANTLVASGRTDIVAFGRVIMNEPHFVLQAAAHYGHKAQYWSPQYLSGKFLAEVLAEKSNEEMLELRLEAKPPNPRDALAIAIARGEVLQGRENKQEQSQRKALGEAG